MSLNTGSDAIGDAEQFLDATIAAVRWLLEGRRARAARREWRALLTSEDTPERLRSERLQATEARHRREALV